MPEQSTLRLRRAWVWPVLIATVVIVFVAAAAAAAIETDTVTSYWRGLWWSISLITTVGFIGEPPRTDAGAALSVVLMLVGFLLLAMVSASLAALFVREEERPRDTREAANETSILAVLERLESRLAVIEGQLESTAGDRSDAADGEEPEP